MPLTVNDRIRGAARGTPAIARSHLNGPDAKDRDYLFAVYEYAPRVFIDPAVVIAITGHETAMLEAPRWNTDLNPGGISITSPATTQPFRIPNAMIAAQLIVSCLNRLVDGRREEDWIQDFPVPIRAWLDTVWARHCQFAPRVERLRDMMTRYAYPDGDVAYTWAEDQGWADGVARRASQLWPNLPNQSSATANDVVFGRVPRPAILDLIVSKAGPGNGYWQLAAPRQIVGGVEHITAGLASIEWYRRFFGIGGERARDALVDFIIDEAGRIAMFNDPWGFRSPWANGSTDGLEGDGPAFVSRFGIDAVNDRLFSTEHIRRGDEPWPDAMMAATIALDAWMFDGAGVRWDTFPVHQDYGVVTHLFHSEFTGKGGDTPSECPGAWIKQPANINRLQDHVRARLKKHQTGVESGAEIPPPGPVEPDHALPGGWTLERARVAFGELRWTRVDGKTVRRTFDPTNGLALAWLQRAVEEGVTNPPTAVRGFDGRYGGGEENAGVAMFSNGWVAVRPARRAGWRWADR